MMVLITYDVNTDTNAGKKRLRLIAKQCVNNGQRVQNSVFECKVDPAQLAELKHRLATIIDKDKDSIRYYYLGNNWERNINHIGIKTSYNPDGPIIL